MESCSLNVTLCDFRDENMLISMIDGTAGTALALAVQDKHRSTVVLARMQLAACYSCVHVRASSICARKFVWPIFEWPTTIEPRY